MPSYKTMAPTTSGINNVSLFTTGASSKVDCPGATLTISFTTTGTALLECTQVDIALYDAVTSNFVETINSGYPISGQATSYTYTTTSSQCDNSYRVRIYCSNVYFTFSNVIDFYGAPTTPPTLAPTRLPTLVPTSMPISTTPMPTPNGFQNVSTDSNHLTCLDDVTVTWAFTGSGAGSCTTVDVMLYESSTGTYKATLVNDLPNSIPTASYQWTTTSVYCTAQKYRYCEHDSLHQF